MKGFIIYATYRSHQQKTYIYLHGRLQNGQTFVTINQTDPYFYIKTKDSKKAKKIQDTTYQKTKKTTFKKQPVTKVILENPKDIPPVRKVFEEQGIECFEADIRFTQRFLIDNNINAAIDIQGDYQSTDNIDRIYKEPELKPAEFDPKLKILSFDIETSADTKELYAISLYTDNYKKVLLKAKKRYKNAISYKTEEELLEAFIKKIQEIDPDIITGWNCIDFDLVMLKKYHQKNKVPFTYGRDNTPNRLRIESSFFRDSKANITGRVILDGIHLLKSSFIKLDNYKLNTAAKVILNDTKLIEKENRWQDIEKLYKKDKQGLVNYNLKDAELVYKILQKEKLIELCIERSQITGMLLDKVNASIASLDSMYLQEAQKKQVVAPSVQGYSREQRILGGYVKSSEPGIYDYIIVLDFKSLYPSIMRTFNIDPYNYTKSKGIKAPNGAHFTRGESILPSILEKIHNKRELAKKRKDTTASYALKITMNSFFGVMASPNCRFYNIDIGNAITHFAQHFIKKTIKEIQKKGYHVIYGDTDSIFINTKATSQTQANKVGQTLTKEINKYYDKHIKKEYKVKSYLELEYEKCYTRFLMPKVRGQAQGAKKRYAGLIKKGKQEHIEFVGLEFVRKDWTQAAKKFQKGLLDKVFHKQEVDKFIIKFIKDLEKGKMDKDLVYQKAMRKTAEEYTKTTPPHVKAARKLEKIDEETSTIQYVMTTDGPEPIQNQKHPLDYKHYIDKQIKPLANQILTFYNLKFEDIQKGNKQTTLFGH